MTRAHRDRLEEALARIETERHPAFLSVNAERARAEADAADARARLGLARGPLDGALIPLKDLFDVVGETTRAGAAMRADAPPAKKDAAIVTRLRAAGAVILGRTHMSEFAFSGLGLNPWDPPLGSADDPSRAPGGSSSGAAVAVAHGLADIAIGTDTGGSCRIPAAVNGVVGVKPSHGATPMAGCLPLARSLDVIGAFGPTVSACAAAFDVIANAQTSAAVAAPPAVSALRLGVLRGGFLEEAEGPIIEAYEAALTRLAAAGAQLVDLEMDDLWREMLSAFPAPLVAIEAASVHWDAIRARPEAFDRRVAARIGLGVETPAALYLNGLEIRQRLILEAAARLARVDAALSPTTPIAAPEIAALEADDEIFHRANRLMLRNPSFGNLFDLCAVSLPLPPVSDARAGLSLAAPSGADRALLATAAAAARALELEA